PAKTLTSLSTSYLQNPSRRNTMEDVHRVVAPFNNDETLAFFAVYDGHGGRGVVDFIETRLEENIAAELGAPDDASINARVERAYLTTDVESKPANLRTSGATAVTCLLRRTPDGGVTVHAANVGDSRAVLCRGGHAERLTYDHKACDAAEQARVEGVGGFILRNRVLGILAVTRSFGDHAGGSNGGGGGGDACSGGGAPECPFLILACDGVWDVMSDSDAVRFVGEAQAAGNEARAAELLVQEALDCGTTDNVTVVIVFF
ncbi:unnamed protein product, partial [Phaeothamnion confervicola]